MTKKVKIKPRSVYAVQTGRFVGQLFVFIDPKPNEEDQYKILSLPKATPKQIACKDIHAGISNNILDFVEKLPLAIFETCVAEYKHKMENPNEPIDRREQSAPSIPLGGEETEHNKE